MQQTVNQGYNLVENTDEINQSLQAWNGNFNKIDESMTSVENGVEALSDNYEPNTVEGTDLYITDSASAPIKDISIGENSEITQDGEPTPENEIDVNVVEGNITLVDQSKNIVDWGNFNTTSATTKFENDVFEIGGTGANLRGHFSILQFVKNHPGKKLHFGFEKLDLSQFNSSNQVIVQLFITNDGVSTYPTILNSSGVITDYTIPDDTSKITLAQVRVLSNNSSTEATSTVKITKPQLELGEVSTSYAKYGKQSYPITLPTGMFLGKIGNASNYIYGDIDNWKLHKGIDVLEDMSTLTSNGLSEGRLGLLTPTLNIDASLSSPNLASIVKCNSLPSIPNNNTGLSGTTDSSKIRIYLSTEYASTYEEAKTFLANKNTKIYYARSTSEDILITDTTLIEQLNTIKRNMTTYKDGTIIFTVTDGLNPSIKLTYGLNSEIETNEKIDKVQSEIDLLKSNFDIDSTPNSNNINITDALNDYNQGNIKIGDGPELEQGENPAPDNPQPIKVVEGSSNLNIKNKNWFDKANITWKRNNTSSYDTGNTDTSTTRIRTSSFEILGGKTYTISGIPADISLMGVRTYVEPSGSTTSQSTVSGNTFTLEEGVKYIHLLFSGTNFTDETKILMKNADIQIQLGEAEMPYASYKHQSYPITLPEGMFLGAIGTASNYIYGTKDNWKLHSGINKGIIDGTGNLTSNALSGDLGNRFTTTDFASLILKASSNSARVNVKVNMLEAKSANATFGGAQGISVSTTGAVQFYMADYKTYDADAMKTWLGTHNLIFYYPLATPTETDITDTTLISQLNAIADNLQTYKGGTIVFTTNENLNPNIQFDYMVNPFASIEARLDLLEA